MAAHDLVIDQGGDILVKDMLFLVGQVLEAPEGVFEGVVLQHIAHGFQLVAEGMAARQLAQHQGGGVHPHILGPHDLVGFDILQHAVLVDAALMAEGVLADDGLVVLDRKAGDVRRPAWRRG